MLLLHDALNSHVNNDAQYVKVTDRSNVKLIKNAVKFFTASSKLVVTSRTTLAAHALHLCCVSFSLRLCKSVCITLCMCVCVLLCDLIALNLMSSNFCSHSAAFSLAPQFNSLSVRLCVYVCVCKFL